MNVVEFLTARLDEEEEDARQASADGHWKIWAFDVLADVDGSGDVSHARLIASTQHVPDAWFITQHDPTRVLADVAARRAIVEGSKPYGPFDVDPDILKYLAVPYSDHPDYLKEWRC